MSKFANIQKRFFDRITKCCNPTEVTITYLRAVSEGDLSDFLGDSQRVPEKTFKLKCLYQRYLNDKQREKAGVVEGVTLSLFVSPLDLERTTGSFNFPAQVRSSYSGIAVQIFGQHHEVESIRDLEPIQLLGRDTCVALQINLKGSRGNTDYN